MTAIPNDAAAWPMGTAPGRTATDPSADNEEAAAIFLDALGDVVTQTVPPETVAKPADRTTPAATLSGPAIPTSDAEGEGAAADQPTILVEHSPDVSPDRRPDGLPDDLLLTAMAPTTPRPTTPPTAAPPDIPPPVRATADQTTIQTPQLASSAAVAPVSDRLSPAETINIMANRTDMPRGLRVDGRSEGPRKKDTSPRLAPAGGTASPQTTEAVPPKTIGPVAVPQTSRPTLSEIVHRAPADTAAAPPQVSVRPQVEQVPAPGLDRPLPLDGILPTPDKSIATDAVPAQTLDAASRPAGHAPLDRPLIPLGELRASIEREVRNLAERSPVDISHDKTAGNTRQTEIDLAPAELGRLKITLQTGERGLHLQISVERPETLEVVRRHMEGLHRDLLSGGLTLDSFDLGTDLPERAKQDAPSDEPVETDMRDAAAQDGDVHTPPPPRPVTVPGRLDIRL